jgi:hypothetical protein
VIIWCRWLGKVSFSLQCNLFESRIHCGLQRGEGFSSQVHQLLILYLIVSEDNEAAFLAATGVLQGEVGFTTITSGWKVRRGDSVSG